MLSLLIPILFGSWLQLSPLPPQPLVTVSEAHGHRPATDKYGLVVAVMPDGAWYTSDGPRGTLTPEQLAQVQAAVAAVAPDTKGPPKIRCRALPIFHTRVDVKGHGQFASARPCGKPLPETVKALVDLVRDVTGDGTLLKFEQGGLPGIDMKVTAQVWPDGRWEIGERRGTLSAEALTTLQQALDRTTFGLEEGRVFCDAETTTAFALHATTSVGRRSVFWAGPCSNGPNASVQELQRLFGELTTVK